MDFCGKTFTEVVFFDFEFRAPPGHRPQPVCLVAHELVSGRVHRVWLDGAGGVAEPPYPVGPDVLFIAYFASAEVGCHLALGWPPPHHVLDLFAEFRVLTNGLKLPAGAGLIGALTYFGLDALDVSAKDAMRNLIMSDGIRTPGERQAILDYCESDVLSLRRLVPEMEKSIDIQLALLRGRFMVAVAAMEHRGIPMDHSSLKSLMSRWDRIQEALVRRVAGDTGVFEGRSFNSSRFEAWLRDRDISWPRHDSGALALDDATFRDMAHSYASIAPIREVRQALAQMRHVELQIGPDGRNRTMLSPYRARTGRGQPSSTKFAFGPSKWMRAFIKPDDGTALAYIDYSRQEFGIAAALSGDANMQLAYASGDAYLAFAIQAGAAPRDATATTHASVRQTFKLVALGVQYGMGPDSLARRLGVSPATARALLDLHHRTYPDFWSWSDGAVDFVNLHGYLHTVFGWRTRSSDNPRSIRNFPMQGNGSEVLRLACILAMDRGVKICAPIHDAILIEAQLEDIEAAVACAREAMRDASTTVLGGFPLDTDVKLIRAPDRFPDESKSGMWRVVSELVAEVA